MGKTQHVQSAFTDQGTRLTGFANQAAKRAKKLRKRSRKLNTTMLLSHLAIVALIVSIISIGYRAPVETALAANASQSVLDQSTVTVDQIAAASVAASAAQSANILVESNVSNLSISLEAKTDLAQTDNSVLNKPQIVQQDSGKRGLARYVIKAGDNVQNVAAAHGISEDTVRWANNLNTDALSPGQTLTIPSTTGVVYTVKAGDDAAKLADRYQADKDRIITYNDAELIGLQPGRQIIIPGGVLPTNERPGYSAPRSLRSGGSTVVNRSRAITFGGNRYDFGYCTFYAYNRRAELGRPIGGMWGNAVSWASYARAAGFNVNNVPAPGAVMQNGGGWGGYGHVAVVERVNDDGSITVSEMNYAGWNVISSRTVPAGQASGYNYIH